MKKFKTFFYPIYLVVIVLVLLMAFNIYDALELLKRWGWYKYFSDLPIMGRNLLVFLCFLMLLELVVENISLFAARSQTQKNEKDIESLKAKLYDKSQEDQMILPEPEDGAEDELD